MAQAPRKVLVEAAEAQPVETETITVRHRGGPGTGIRYIHLSNGQQCVLRRGESAEIEIPAAEAERMRKLSSEDPNYDIEVGGSERKESRRDAPKELSRQELDALERENLDAASKANAAQRSEGGGSGGSGGTAEKMSRGDLEGMTKEELVEYAQKHNIDVKASDNKAEIISDIMKAQRHT